jgi:serine/threonine protein kinase
MEKSKKVGHYVVKVDEFLGKGAFAATYRAYKDKNYKHPYACKVISKSEVKEFLKSDINYFIKRVQEEYRALQSLKHEGIVSFEDFEETGNNIYLFF